MLCVLLRSATTALALWLMPLPGRGTSLSVDHRLALLNHTNADYKKLYDVVYKKMANKIVAITVFLSQYASRILYYHC